MKKYKFTGETKEVHGTTFIRIQRISDGLIGGWIESEDNLSHEGNCFIYDEACVYGDAQVYEDAMVSGYAVIEGNAKVFGKAQVFRNAWVFGNAWIFGNARIYGEAKVYGNAGVFGNAEVLGYAQVYGNVRVYGDAVVRNTESLNRGERVGKDKENIEIKEGEDKMENEISKCKCKKDCKGKTQEGMDSEAFRKFREEVFQRIHKKMDQKNADYTAGASVFANFEMTEGIGIPAINGLLIRFLDKVQRLKSFALNGKLEVEGEGVTDAWEDIIGYSFIALGMLQEKETKIEK